MDTTSRKIGGSAVRSGELKGMLTGREPEFWPALREATRTASSFPDVMRLSTFRRRAAKDGFQDPTALAARGLKIALIGGSSLYPLSELVEHFLSSELINASLFIGDYDNYVSEILDLQSKLYEFGPEIVVVIPGDRSCKHAGGLTDSQDAVTREAERVSGDLLHLCTVLRDRASSEIFLCNFIPPAYRDIGPIRSKIAASEWSFKRAVNFALGAKAPSFVHICDLEFLSYRLGGMSAQDERSWFESKQPCSAALMVDLAREIAYMAASIKRTPKKVLVLDLDNTLWGGVIGDDGIEGIEIGSTSPLGEAFRAFQSYIASLTERGVLLAACSKNDFENAIDPFRRHPEMVLKEEDFVAFKANWEPKSTNIIEIANELQLGLDSFIFVDDNPAEIEIVRQFAPDVTTILLGPDPAEYVRQLKDSRYFERFAITDEDRQRTKLYRVESERKQLRESVADMDSYLSSLEMIGRFKEFDPIDLPRIAQLVNKSNQFNLTTKRRTEGELTAIAADPRYIGFSMRLADRFGDHGLISVVICKQAEFGVLEIDTWLMSCRVLKRQAEGQVMNEIVRIARCLGCTRIQGDYFPTPKNEIVENLLPNFGFERLDAGDHYELKIDEYNFRKTHITIESRTNFDEHFTAGSSRAATEYI